MGRLFFGILERSSDAMLRVVLRIDAMTGKRKKDSLRGFGLKE